MSISNSRVVEVDLFDISNSHIGFDLTAIDIRKLSVGSEDQSRGVSGILSYSGGDTM